MNVIDFSFAQKRSILKKISLDLPILPHLWGWEMDMSHEIESTLTRLCGCSGCARGNRCRSRWTLRLPDPEGRESATPFLRWLPVHVISELVPTRPGHVPILGTSV